MSGYGFKKPSAAPAQPVDTGDKLDLSGIARTPVALDPQREGEAVARGAAMGFVDRDERVQEEVTRPSRRRRETVPQGNLFIKVRRRRWTGSSSTPTAAATAPTGKRWSSCARLRARRVANSRHQLSGRSR